MISIYIGQSTEKEASKSTRNVKGKMASTVSVSLRFRTQLDSLMTTLRSTRAFYIKCIKPNSLKKKGVFEGSLVNTQLKYSGNYETQS